MSLALATRGIISGFLAVGGAALAVPVCEPEITSEEYGELRLHLSSSEIKPSIYGEDLRPSIKISIED